MEQSSQSPLFQRTSDVLKRYQKDTSSSDDIENQSPLSTYANVATKLVLSTPSPGEELNNSTHIDIASASKKNLLKNYMNNQLELNEQESQYYEDMIYKLAEEMEDVKAERDGLLVSKNVLSSSIGACELKLVQADERLKLIQSENNKMKMESDDIKKQVSLLKSTESSQLKEIERLKSLADNGKVANDDLRKQVTSLSADAMSSKSTIADLKAQLESSAKVIQDLEADLKHSSSVSKNLEENSSSVLKVYMDNQLDLQQADFQYYEDTISQLAIKLEEMTADRDELKLSNDDLNKQLTAQLDEADRKLLDYESLLNSKDDELALADEALKDIQSKFETAKKQMEVQIQSSRIAAIASKASSPAGTPSVSALTQTTPLPVKTEEPLVDDVAKIADLESAISKKDSEIRAQVLQLQSLQDALQEFKSDNALLKEHRKGLKEMVQSLKKKLEDVTNELSITRSNSGHSEEDKTDFKSHINVLENEIQTQKNKLETYHSEIEILMAQRQLEIESFNEYKTRYESLPAKLQRAEESKGALQEANAGLQKQIEYSNSKVESLAGEIKLLHERNSALENDIQTEREIAANLSNLLQQAFEQGAEKMKPITPLASSAIGEGSMEQLLFGSPTSTFSNSPFNVTPTKKSTSSVNRSIASPKKVASSKSTTPIKATQTPQSTKSTSALKAEVEKLSTLSDHLRARNSSLLSDLSEERGKAGEMSLRLTLIEGELKSIREHEATLLHKLQQAERSLFEKDAEIVGLCRNVQDARNESSAACAKEASDSKAQVLYMQETYRNLLHDYEVFRSASVENSLNEQNDKVLLEDKIRRLEEDLSNKRDMLKDNEEAIHALRVSSAEKGRDSLVLQDEIDRLQQEVEMRAAKWSQLEINLKLELDEERSNVRVLEGATGNLKAHIVRLEADNMSIADALTSNFSSSAEIGNELRDCRAQIESLRSEVAELEIINGDITCKLLEKQREVNSAREDFLQFKNSGYKDTLLSLTDAESALRDARMDMEMLRIEYDGVKNEKKSIEESLLHSNENVSKLRNAVTKTNGRCDAVLMENRNLRDLMDKMHSTHNELSKEAQESKCTLDAYKEHLMTIAVDMKVVSDSMKVKSVARVMSAADATPLKEGSSSGLFNSPIPTTFGEEFEKLLLSLDRRTDEGAASVDMKAVALVNECYGAIRANAELMLEEHSFLSKYHTESQDAVAGLKEIVSDYENQVLKLTLECDQTRSQLTELQRLMVETSAPTPAAAPAAPPATSASAASLLELRKVYDNKAAMKEYEITTLQSQLSDVQSQFNQVRNLLASETKEKNEVQKSVGKLQGELDQLLIEVKSLRITRDYTITDSSSSASSDSALEAEKLLAALNVTLENFKFNNKASNASSKQGGQTLTGRTDEAISRLGELRAAFRSEATAKKGLEDKVNSLKEDLSRSQNVALQAQKDLMVRNRSLPAKALPASSFAPDTHSNSTSIALNEKMKLISSLENIIMQKDSELGGLRVKVSTSEVEISDLKRQLQQSQALAEGASNDRSECNRKAAELLQVQNSLNKLRGECDQAESCLKTTRDQYLRLTESKLSMEESQQMLLRKVYQLEQRAEQEARVRSELEQELESIRAYAERQGQSHIVSGSSAAEMQKMQVLVESERAARVEETRQLRGQLQSLRAAYDKKETQLQEISRSYRRPDSKVSTATAIDIPVSMKERVSEMIGVIREVVNVVRVEATAFGQEINTPDAKTVKKIEARKNRLAGSSGEADKMGLCELNTALDALKEVISWVRDTADFRSEHEAKLRALLEDNRRLEVVLADSLSSKYYGDASAAGKGKGRKALAVLSDVSNQKMRGVDLDRSVSFEDISSIPTTGKQHLAVKTTDCKENSSSTVSYVLKSVTGSSSGSGFLRVSSNRK